MLVLLMCSSVVRDARFQFGGYSPTTVAAMVLLKQRVCRFFFGVPLSVKDCTGGTCVKHWFDHGEKERT